MARSKETFSKKEIEKKKIQKRKEKAARREERKASAGRSFEDMIAYTDEDGNILTTTETLPTGARMRAGTANGSNGFFACFEGGDCGPNMAPALPANCTEDGGLPVPATSNTVNHNDMLSASELRLISEWLDIGAQYYNNPFDTRLTE